MDDDATVRVERGRAALCALKGVPGEPLRAGVSQVLPRPATGSARLRALFNSGSAFVPVGRNLAGRRQDVAQYVDLDLGRQSEMVQRRPQRLQQNGIVSAGLGQKADVALAAGYGERLYLTGEG
jgi:hypothetical protein